MINVSKEFQTAIKERTDFLQYGKITFTDGTVLDLAPADFTISNNKVIDSAGSSRIPLGSVVCRSIQIELMNDDERYSSYDFFGAVIKIQAKLQLSETVETVDFGEFTVVTPETYGETVIITAVDDVWKTDREFTTTLVFPTTTGALLRDICSLCDLSLGTTTFRNSDFEIQSIPDGNYTFRAVIGYIAQIAGGNARINRYGKLEIISYDFATLREKYSIYDGGYYNPWNNEIVLDGGTFSPWTNGENIDGGTYGDRDSIHLLYQWSYIKVDTDDVVITGVQTEYTNDADEKVTLLEGIEGYVLGIDNPLIAGKESEAIKLIGAVMIGAQFRQFEGDHISYPLAEFMDPCWIVDRKNHVYTSIITDINFSFWGLTTLKNSAETAVRNSSQYSSEATKSYIKAQKLVVKERTDREKAVENLAKALSDAGGLYMTTETLEDGSSIYYMHDKPSLKESKIVWKLTSLAFGISTDGGKTYPYGFTVDGETIVRLLYADGIDVNNLVVGENVTMGPNATISWSKVTGTGDVALKSDVPSDAYITKITKDTITVAYLNALEIEAASVSSVNSDGDEFSVKNGYSQFYKGGMAFGGIGAGLLDTNGVELRAAIFRTYGDVIDFSYYNTPYYVINPSGHGLTDNAYSENHYFRGSGRFTNRVAALEIEFSNKGTRLYDSSYGSGNAVISSGGFYANGDMGCSGTKYRVVETENYGNRGMNAFETAEPYFADVGSNVIGEGGTCKIDFDPIFAETVEIGKQYQVQLTRTSEKETLWVEKHENYFIVHGDPGATFDWMLMCKQKGYADVRMQEINFEEVKKDE